MYTINDPMFALILHFVGRYREIEVCDNEFIQKELHAIQEHVKKFPPREQELRALEWIEEHAKEYRKAWERKVVVQEFSGQKCPDCPLARRNNSRHCQIHDQWAALLQRYSEDEINSKEYVERVLRLLTQHKEDLKVKLSRLNKEGRR